MCDILILFATKSANSSYDIWVPPCFLQSGILMPQRPIDCNNRQQLRAKLVAVGLWRFRGWRILRVAQAIFEVKSQLGWAIMFSAMSKRCYQCERDNPADQAFCGGCGSALTLNDYISKKVEEQLRDAIRDRDVVETESSIKVFERAWGWVKVVGAIATVLLALVGAGVFWKVSDWWKSVDSAKQSVINTATTTRNEIALASSHSLQEVTAASEKARKTSEDASADASRQSRELQRTVLQTKAELSREAGSVRSEVEKSRSQLQAASELQPQMAAMQQQLAHATAEIQAQQKVISSSEDFVKSVFSSHRVEIFNIGQPPIGRATVVPPATKGNKNSVVYLLLSATPIPGTLQVQYHI